MAEIRLVAPEIRVVRASQNGSEPLVIQTDNRDMLAWETTARRHKWGTIQESPFRWLTFLAWSAARRAGELETSVTYEAWEEDVLSVMDTRADGQLGIPTDAGPGPA